jgi:hypothetical protein
MRALPFAVVAALLSIVPANAQVVLQERPSPERQGPPVRIQVGVSLFVPGSATDADESRLRQARRTLYDLAGRECDLLREVLARDCRLESVNVNLNRQGGQQYGQHLEGFMANANFTLQVVPK